MNRTQSLMLAIILSLSWLPAQSTHAAEKAPKANNIRQVSPGVYHIPESEVLRLLGSMAFPFKLRLSRKGKALVLTYLLETPKPPPARKAAKKSKKK